MKPIHRWAAALVALALPLSLTPPAQARTAGELFLTLETLVIDRQNESGNDEIFIRFRPTAGVSIKAWPTDRTTMNVNAGDCWYINFERGCPNGYTNKSIGAQGSLPGAMRPGTAGILEIWEDDIAGDDLLLSVVFPVTDEPWQDLVLRGTRQGADYTLSAHLS